MSYIKAPNDHQSTAFPWPLRVKISGALQKKNKITVDIKDIKTEHLHVLDSATESVCYDAFLNVFFAQTEVGQLYVTFSVKQNVFGL